MSILPWIFSHTHMHSLKHTADHVGGGESALSVQVALSVLATVKPGVLHSGHIPRHHSFPGWIESLFPKADSSPWPSSFLSAPHTPIPDPTDIFSLEHPPHTPIPKPQWRVGLLPLQKALFQTMKRASKST